MVEVVTGLRGSSVEQSNHSGFEGGLELEGQGAVLV